MAAPLGTSYFTSSVTGSGSAQNITDSVAQRRNRELSTVKIKVWADFSATRKQCQKTVNWLIKLAPEAIFRVRK